MSDSILDGLTTMPGVKMASASTCLPLGAGFYVTLNKRRRSHRIGIEINWRYTNTDYLDDISLGRQQNPVIRSLEAQIAMPAKPPARAIAPWLQADLNLKKIKEVAGLNWSGSDKPGYVA